MTLNVAMGIGEEAGAAPYREAEEYPGARVEAGGAAGIETEATREAEAQRVLHEGARRSAAHS